MRFSSKVFTLHDLFSSASNILCGEKKTIYLVTISLAPFMIKALLVFLSANMSHFKLLYFYSKGIGFCACVPMKVVGILYLAKEDMEIVKSLKVI